MCSFSRTYAPTTQQFSHFSINPEGSALATLTVSTGGPLAFTLGQVVYSIQGHQFDLGIVPASGQSPLTILAGQPIENLFSFVYRTDFMYGHGYTLSRVLALQYRRSRRNSDPQYVAAAIV